MAQVLQGGGTPLQVRGKFLEIIFGEALSRFDIFFENYFWNGGFWQFSIVSVGDLVFWLVTGIGDWKVSNTLSGCLGLDLEQAGQKDCFWTSPSVARSCCCSPPGQ